MKQHIAAVLFLTVMLCGCQSGCKFSNPQTEPTLRDGVVDIPIETAPEELWAAAQVWDLQKSSVSVVVMTSNDSSRTVTYFLDIGFEQDGRKVKREEFHRQLISLGWELTGERNDHSATYSGKGRHLHIGFDTGMHPTSLIVKYEKQSTQQGAEGDAVNRAP